MLLPENQVQSNDAEREYALSSLPMRSVGARQ